MGEAIFKLENYILDQEEQWALYGTSDDRCDLERQCGRIDGLKEALKVLKGEK